MLPLPLYSPEALYLHQSNWLQLSGLHLFFGLVRTCSSFEMDSWAEYFYGGRRSGASAIAHVNR